MRNVTTTKKCSECGLCCYFTRGQKYLAPYFSKRELKLIDRKKIIKTSRGLFQAKVVKAKTKKGFFRCIFLNEKTYRCLIYRKKPLDCVTWPFIIGFDKKRKGLYLWISDSSFCPAVPKINKIKKSGIINHVINNLKKKKFFEEIKNRERFLWPYQSYQMRLKKIKN